MKSRGMPRIGIQRRFAPYNVNPAITDHTGAGFLFLGTTVPRITEKEVRVKRNREKVHPFWAFNPLANNRNTPGD